MLAHDDEDEPTSMLMLPAVPADVSPVRIATLPEPVDLSAERNDKLVPLFTVMVDEFCTLITPARLLPMLTAPVEVPVLMFVAKLLVSLRLIAAPDTVKPSCPVTRPLNFPDPTTSKVAVGAEVPIPTLPLS